MHPTDAAGIANSIDPDQTTPPGAVWSGFALFVQTCLSENLGSLRYVLLNIPEKKSFIPCIPNISHKFAYFLAF